MSKLRIIVGGYIGLYPTGGVTWDYVQYPMGLRDLGHDVYYVEDTAQFPKFQTGGKSWDDASDSIAYLKQQMEAFGLGNRWAYRDVATGECFGMSERGLRDICESTDVFINISASTFLRDEYLAIPVRVLIDSDPMFTQIDYYDAKQQRITSDRYKIGFMVENHTHHFSFGENIGNADCLIPTLGVSWISTRQPICMDSWHVRHPKPSPKPSFTSVMNWSARKDLYYNGYRWGQKDKEFEKVKGIPGHFPFVNFEVNATRIPPETRLELTQAGWVLTDALSSVSTPERYKAFIEASTAEFSVAKETYVKSRSGWFSGRSACYLAAGRPVVAQDTAWSRSLPAGRGLLAFEDEATAVNAVAEVLGDIQGHSFAAVEIAECFNSRRVLSQMLDEIS